MPKPIVVNPGVIHPGVIHHLPSHLKKFFVLYEGKVDVNSGKTVNVQLTRRAKDGVKINQAGSQADPNGGENWVCQTTPVTESVSTGKAIVMNPNYHMMYPGAVYDIKAIADGSYDAVPFSRKPLTLKIDNVYAKQPAVTVNNPSSPTVQQAVNTMVGSQIHPGGSQTYGAKFKMLSDEDYYMRTGGSGHFLGFGGSHSFEMSSSRHTNKYVLEVYQVYYTISVDDSLNEPRDFFYLAEEQNSQASQPVPAGQLNPNWVCVDAVKYGRILHVVFESDEQLETLGLDIEAWAQWGLASGEANLSLRQKKALNRTSITVRAQGGSAPDAAKILTANNLVELEQIINGYFSGTHDEELIGYSLRTLDGDTVGARMTAEYTARNCRPAADTYAIHWQQLFCKQEDDGDGEEIKAFVRIRVLKGDGSDYLDEDKINNPLVLLPANPFPGMPVPWSMSKGSEAAPIHLDTGETRSIDQKMVFHVDPNDVNARIRLEADVIEFDAISDDNFAGDKWEKKVTDIGINEAVTLTCSHDKSRIEFNFVVTPVFD